MREDVREDQHVNVNQKNNDGGTGLHWACDNGHLEVVKYLVEKAGANKNIRTSSFGYTPLDLAKKLQL